MNTALFTHCDATIVTSDEATALARALHRAINDRRVPVWYDFLFADTGFHFERQIAWLDARAPDFPNANLPILDAIADDINVFLGMERSEGVEMVLWHCRVLKYVIENDLSFEDIVFIKYDAHFDTSKVSNTGSRARIYAYDLVDTTDSTLLRATMANDPFRGLLARS